MITVFIIAIGEIAYKQDSLDVLKNYFSNQEHIKLFILENDSYLINVKKAHPSWLKLISHHFTNDDNFTLCIDLDLLPINKNIDIIKYLDLNKINMCYDTSVLTTDFKFNNNFKFNGGLLGIPFSERLFMEKIYYENAPGLYPSYEQYYLNDALAFNFKEINILPNKLNSLYPQNYDSQILFNQAVFLHYTWGCSVNERPSLIKDHKLKYFSHD